MPHILGLASGEPPPRVPGLDGGLEGLIPENRPQHAPRAKSWGTAIRAVTGMASSYL